MTREQAKREIDSLDYYLQNYTDDYSEESHTAMMMAVSALSENAVLDKIRNEITMLHTFNRQNVIEIIDKYKAESEKK